MPNKTRCVQRGRGNGNVFSTNNPSLLNEHGWTPLHEAVYRNNGNEVIRLLNAGYNIDKKDNTGRTPLHVAFEFGRYDIAKLLIKNGASLNIKDRQGINGQWYLNKNATENYPQMKMNENKINKKTLKNKFKGLFGKKKNTVNAAIMTNKNRNAARRASLMSFASPRR